jgi:hypothetical protein
MKPFHEITTDAEYLRAVGMGPDTHPELYQVWTGRIGSPDWNNKGPGWHGQYKYCGPPIEIHNPDPANKWRDLANVLLVLGPEVERRNWSISWADNFMLNRPYCFAIELRQLPRQKPIGYGRADSLHLSFLEAFYHAHHAQGE